MPRNVRNFWIEVEIDGRAQVIKGGSPSKDGGMKVKLYQRVNNEVEKVMAVNCEAFPHEVDPNTFNLETVVTFNADLISGESSKTMTVIKSER